MKLNLLWELKLNEIEVFSFLSFVMGLIMLIIGAGWDSIVGIYINHNQGYGIYQIAWMAFWGIYSFWAWYIVDKWGEK